MSDALNYLSDPEAVVKRFVELGNKLAPEKIDFDTMPPGGKRLLMAIMDDAVCGPVQEAVGEITRQRELYVNSVVLNTSVIILQKLMEKCDRKELKQTGVINELIEDAQEIASSLIVKVHGAMAATLTVELPEGWSADVEGAPEVVADGMDPEIKDDFDQLLNGGENGSDETD